MTKPRKPTRKPTKREPYPDEFKVEVEAVKLADTVGTTQAASELKLQISQICSWLVSIVRKESTSKAESRLLSENASLRRQSHWLDVSRSGYYEWKQRQNMPSPRHELRQSIDKAVC